MYFCETVSAWLPRVVSMASGSADTSTCTVAPAMACENLQSRFRRPEPPTLFVSRSANPRAVRSIHRWKEGDSETGTARSSRWSSSNEFPYGCRVHLRSRQAPHCPKDQIQCPGPDRKRPRLAHMQPGQPAEKTLDRKAGSIS